MSVQLTSVSEYLRIRVASSQCRPHRYTTWQLSFDRLRIHSPQAVALLQHCVFLHYDGIAQAIFQNAAVHVESSFDHEPNYLRNAKDLLGLFLTSGAWDTWKFLKVLSEIRSYSLIDFDDEAKVYSIHPFVHDWICGTMSIVEATRASAVYPWDVGQLEVWV